MNQPLWLLLCFCGGVVSVRFLTWPGTPSLIALVVAASLIVACRYPSIRWIAVFLIGLGWAALVSTQLLSRSIPQHLEKQDLEIVGHVEGLVRSSERGSRFNFRVESMQYRQQPLESPGLIRLGIYDPQLRPRSGERWRFTARLKQPHGYSNPGSGFHYETWLFHQRIRATGYVVGGMAEPSPGGRYAVAAISGWYNRLLMLRQGFSGFIGQVVANPVVGGILSALSVGIREDLEDADWEVLQDTGTIHLVAISGLHIGFVALIAGTMAARLWRITGALCGWMPARTAGALAGLVAGALYALLAGFTLPTRRALGMLFFAVAVLVIRRRPKPLAVLAGVLTGILVVDPLAPLSSSFWLSFSAVAILLLTAMGAEPRASVSGLARLWVVAGKWGVMQCWLLLGMMPVLLAGFQKFSLVAPAGNLIAVPAIGMLVVPMVLAGFVCWMAGLPRVAEILLIVCSELVERVWDYLEWLASLSRAVWQQGLPPLWSILIAVSGVVLVMVGRALPGRWLGLVGLLPMFLAGPARPDPGEFRLVVLDVGQGLGVIVQTRNHVLVYDTGAAYAGGFNLGKVVMVPALRHFSAKSIDTLVISHADNDHIGGAAAVAGAFPMDTLLSSAPSRAPVPARHCEQGQNWQRDGVRFSILWPPAGHPYRGNGSSCVMQVSSAAGSVLFTGDIDEDLERTLVRQYGERLRSDVLIVPHHGSKSSSSPVLLGTVRPRIGVVSAGYRNRFGHPAALVARRYAARDIPLMNTAEEGAITAYFGATKIQVEGQRSITPAFWKQAGKTDFNSVNKRINID